MEGSHTPAGAMSLSEEITLLRMQVKEQYKEIRRLKEENEFPEETSAFFRRQPSEVSKKQRISRTYRNCGCGKICNKKRDHGLMPSRNQTVVFHIIGSITARK